MGNHIYAGAEWIGSVPEHWKFYKGKFIFGESNEKGNANNLELLSPTQKYGVIPQTLYEQYTTLRTVKIKEDTDLNTFKTVHKGNFCISLRSFQGGFEYSEYEGVVSPAYHILYSRRLICDGYYKYLFKEQSFIAEMNSYCQTLRDGKNISYSDFGKTLIPYPPINEQQAIANYLDDRCSKIDAIIAEAKASIEEYKELKQAVIYEAVTKGLDKNAKMKDSSIEWLGSIPAQWNLVKTNRIIYNTQNGLTRRDLDKSDGQIVLKLKNINAEGEIDYSDTNRIQLTNDEIEKYRLHNGDLLFVRVNGSRDLVGKCAIFEEKDEAIAYNDHIIRVTLNDYCIPEYVKWYLLCDSGKSEIALKINTAAGQFTISGEGLRAIYMPLPSLNEQREIVEFLNNKTKKIDFIINEKQSLIEDLEAYKKSLIYEVVTGKRKVVA